MRNFKRKFAVILASAIAVSALSISAAAEDPKDDGEAGIDFIKGDTTIEPGPDPLLPGINDGDIYFGEQKISASTEYYLSTAHTDEDRQYAGYIVNAGNDDGWEVSVAITGFQINNRDTMKNFKLELFAGTPQTNSENADSIAPQAKGAILSGGNDMETAGDSAPVFKAGAGEGFGKWGCNWSGELTVVGGSVAETGNATATMLWTLNPASVRV